MRRSVNRPLTMFEINIGRLAEGEHQYRFEGSGLDLDLGASFHRPVAVDVVLDRSGRQFLLRAQYRTRGVFACDRCTESFEKDIAGSYKILYVPDGGPAPLDGERGEVQEIPSDALVISLDEDLRQFLLLNVPGKLLCRDDCRGLCPTCGTNWNTGSCDCAVPETDSRWDALRDLRRH